MKTTTVDPYPWALWLDGDARTFTQGVDFHSTPESFIAYFRKRAHDQGLGSQVCRVPGTSGRQLICRAVSRRT